MAPLMWRSGDHNALKDLLLPFSVRVTNVPCYIRLNRNLVGTYVFERVFLIVTGKGRFLIHAYLSK